VREVDVVGVRVEMPSSQPIVLLKEVGGERYLPIWIGAAEASAIAFAQQGMEPPRPLTHDLFAETLRMLGHTLSQVRIVKLTDGGVFEAILVFDDKTEVSARPSDSIALALRTGTPVFCADEILAEAGIPVPASETDGTDEVEEEEEVERFREFLDQVTPEDFDKS
jgi:bifunctional DNase/RNase